ncbi:hypothetical protein ACFWPU_45120 [Streptomyces sp. NPDC058471]|uniref:hypothetical protein n=1 Tax=Streptomyces sp. NPDC058471 TaxID=3346516 RepID=UPI003651BE1B
MSPKKQSTAARKARAAAREGAKYTEALRSASPDPAAPDWDDLVVSALSAVAAEHGVVPVTVIWNEDARHSMVQRDNGVRWGVAEAAADGVVIREVRGDVGVVAKGTRVPVPHRLDDGRVEVAVLWPVVWCSNDQPFWRYVHTGWSVEEPGAFPAALDPMCPSPELPYEVRVYSVPDGIVGEDHSGDAPSWWTRAWCDRLDKAVLLADTSVAHQLSAPERPASGDCGTLRAEVWQHSTSDLGTLPARVHRADAEPDRPVVPRLPFDTWPEGRPASTEPTAEPTWFQGKKHPPTYDLRVWSAESGWEPLGWFVGGLNPASIAAALLRVGTGGPFPFAETWGPHHPDAWADDWTQEGRALMDRHPDEPYAEGTVRYAGKRRQEAVEPGGRARRPQRRPAHHGAGRCPPGGRWAGVPRLPARRADLHHGRPQRGASGRRSGQRDADAAARGTGRPGEAPPGRRLGERADRGAHGRQPPRRALHGRRAAVASAGPAGVPVARRGRHRSSRPGAAPQLPCLTPPWGAQGAAARGEVRRRGDRGGQAIRIRRRAITAAHQRIRTVFNPAALPAETRTPACGHRPQSARSRSAGLLPVRGEELFAQVADCW